MAQEERVGRSEEGGPGVRSLTEMRPLRAPDASSAADIRSRHLLLTDAQIDTGRTPHLASCSSIPIGGGRALPVCAGDAPPPSAA
eukprot:3369957-Rhodomonas_salina.1